jgi:cephalosporin hydroxylase
MLAMRAYEPAVVATQQWYLGPGQQGDSQQAGYDQQAEDLLLSRISWPADGYRLFEIGHFIGERDWFDGMVESNCLFVPRKLLEQVGVFDTAFDMPGGGYANLELFERLTHTPGVECASILGEGTFHQFHGGTTTNVADEALRRERIVSYREHFVQARGRTLNGLDRPTRYVGAMTTRAARRTRSRRAVGLRFDPFQAPGADERASTSVPIADELKLAAIEGVWDKQAWREATWLGHPVNRFPSDLHAYQELIARLDPALVLIVAEDFGLGGRALHAATVLEQVGQGRVVAVGESEGPSHARIAYHASTDDLPGDMRGPAVVFLGLQRVPELLSAFERFAPLVAVDGYVVVENTVLNGRPAEPGFGPGPHEAVVRILEQHSDFVADPAPERYTVTFNRSGYLRRVREAAIAEGTP